MRIRADRYAKCFRCGWKGWLDGPPIPEREIERAERQRVWFKGVVDRVVKESRTISTGCPVDRYLDSRYLRQPYPRDLLFHHACYHGPTKSKWPAMIALVKDDEGHVVGVHRTFLTKDGKKAPIEPNKMTLGSIGGNAVHFEPLSPFNRDGSLLYPSGIPRTIVGVCEGIEDGLAVRMRWRGFGVWVCLSANNFTEPPRQYRCCVIYPDRDEAGATAADDLFDIMSTDMRTKMGGRGPWVVDIHWPHCKDHAEDWIKIQERRN